MNLDAIRSGLLGFTLVMLTFGYAASQWFFFNGRAKEYATLVDVPSLRMLSLVLLFAFIALAFVPIKEESA